MAQSKFTPDVRATIVAEIRNGTTLPDACQRAGVRVKTAEGWLARGRRETEGRYATFAADVDQARHAAAQATLTREEFEKHLAKAVRGGSFQALKLWWEIHGKQRPPSGDEDEPDDPFDALGAGEKQKRR